MEEYQSYKLVTATGSDNLTDAVNEELEGGFIPYGSPTSSQSYLGDDKDGKPKIKVLFCQAIVLPYPKD